MDEDVALATHRWQWDEGSSGVQYEYCTRCARYKDDCKANEFHGAVACDQGAWRVRTQP